MDDADKSVMSVIGVYTDCYRDQLVELEWTVSESSLAGPVIVLKNFNALLGGQKCTRG